MTPVVAADVRTAHEIGLMDWQRDLSWPVSEGQFRDLCESLDREFDTAYEALDETTRDLFLADLTYTHFLAQYVHAKSVEVRADQSGVAVRFGKEAGTLYSPNWESKGNEYRARLRREQPHFPTLRLLRRRFIYNDHLPFRRALWSAVSPGKTWNLGAWTAAKKAYVRQKELVCDFPFLERFARAKNLSPADTGTADMAMTTARDVLFAFLTKLADQARELDVTLDIDPILQTWMERLASLRPLYLAALEHRRMPDTILIGRAGYAFIRTVALAMRRAGARTVGFQHGHNPGYTHNATRNYVSISVSDEFVSVSPKAAESLETSAHRTAFTNRRATKFVSVPVPVYRELWERHGGRVKGGPVRSVILLGYPMNANRYVYGTGLFWSFKLDLELRIVRTLRHAGLRVLYKPHPDSAAIMNEVMASEVDQVLLRPFESEYQMVDGLIFTYPHTTTFGFALCSEKPIVLINMEGEAWYDEIRTLISDRCVFVGARFDERNRVVFDADELLQAIEASPNRRSDKYVSRYLLAETD